MEPWFGGEMRRLRVAAGLSLSAFAEKVHYSKGYLSRIETGDKRPHEDLARLVDSTLGAEGALLSLFHQSIWDRRRPAPMITVAPPEQLSTVSAMAAALIHDRQTLLDYENAFRRRREDGRSMPAALVLPAIEPATRVLIEASSRPGPQRAELLDLASRYAEFYGWMLQEVGRNQEAIDWTQQAVELAAAAGNETMQSHALVRRALFSLYQGVAADTINLAVQAANTPGGSARTLRQAYQRQAQGHALASDPYNTERALALAEGLPPDQVVNESGLALGPSANAESHAMTVAWCLVELGQGRRAAEILAPQLAAVPNDHRRTRARFGIRYALAHALDGEPDQAVLAADLVLNDVVAIRSATVNIDVARLRRTMARWHTHSPVRQLNSRLDAVLSPAASAPAGRTDN